MLKWGLKLWSVNDNYAVEVIRLHKARLFDYLELFIVPGTTEGQLRLWIDLKDKYGIKYVAHAPHSMSGLNLAKRECLDGNLKLAKEALTAADRLGAEIVIFHPGIGGKDEEAVSQIKKFFDSRIVVENKPYYPLTGKDSICNGNSPESIKYIMENTGAGFCLDIGHAICSANAQNKDRNAYLRLFMELKPKMFHISDGDNESVFDSHVHIGSGSYDLKSALAELPANSLVTIETEKDSRTDLKDFVGDLKKLKELAR